MAERVEETDRTSRERLFTMLIANGLWGVGLGIAFVAGAVLLDLGRLRHLISFSADGAIALALLTLGAIVTFSSVAMGGAIMMIGRREEDGGGRAAPEAITRQVPAIVPIRSDGARRIL